MARTLLHRDCQNFAPVDVVKGICHRTKEMTPADRDACAACSPVAKCRRCLNYLPDAPSGDLGSCDASPAKFFAYAEMVAVTCEHFRPLDFKNG